MSVDTETTHCELRPPSGDVAVIMDCADNLKHDAIDLILDMQEELDNICQMGDGCNNNAVK